MQGLIEYHGAKQFLSTGVAVDSEEGFIPGDEVAIINSKPHLIKRQEQAAIGIVTKVNFAKATLYIPNFGLTCRFAPTVANVNYQTGTRLVLWLYKDGQIEVKAQYPSSCEFDAIIINHMYSLTQERVPQEEKFGNHLYTVDDIIDHDDLDTFTIDPASSKDFDDAISVDISKNIVYIHIVDIGSVKLTEEDNRRLRDRCLTLYLSNELTNHLIKDFESLSLVENKQRQVITVKVMLDEGGLVLNYDIYRSTIVVKRRYNYEQAGDLPTADIRYLAELTKKRSSNVSYNINLPSLRILSSADGVVESITSENTNDVSHSLVATAMILANLIVSKHLRKHGVSLPNRFHDSLRGFSPPEFNKTGNDHVDSFIMVKRYSKAYYSIDERGHFGLGITDYVHFTSPMRRYADVLVHRILAGYNNDNLEEEVTVLNHRASVTRAAQDIYRSWKVIQWLQKNKENQDIWVTGVNKSGILWFMPSLSLNGFIHISEIEPKQYWKFDLNKESLIGQNNGLIISLGKRLLTTNIRIDVIKSVLYPTILL